MIASGLRIFNAYPGVSRGVGETFLLLGPAATPIPGWADVRRAGLAGARATGTFAMMWVLVANGFRLSRIHLSPRASGATSCRAAASFTIRGRMVKFYVGKRKNHPRQGKNNALQRTAYFRDADRRGDGRRDGHRDSGKPVQLAWLTNAMGGYVWARYFHFWAMLLLVIPHRGSRIHGIRRRPVLDSVDDHGEVQRGVVARKARNARPLVHLLPPKA